jgi:putative transposase
VRPKRHGAGLTPEGKDQAEGKKTPLSRRRHSPRTLTDREARSRALAWLLPLLTVSLERKFSPSVLRRVADLILRAAARHYSIARARARSKRGPSERHSQRVLEHLGRRKTQRALTLALREQARPFIPPHPVDVAVDFHETPYYGEAIDSKHPQFVKTKEERGTHRAYRYVTLDLVVHGFRLTVAARYLDHRGRLVAVLRDVLRDARKAGVQIGRLYLDREFYTYDVLAWLSGEGRTVIVPLRLGSRQRKRWERGQKSYVSEHTLKDSKGKGAPLPLRVHVVVRYQKGRQWKKHGCQYLVYAVLGHLALDARHRVPLHQTHELYRRRFGIESSYRIAHLALPRTCARSVAWRLLYLGVALMLENEWCIVRLLYTSEGRQGPTGMVLREELLRFEDLLELLFLGVSRVLGTVREVGNRKPPPRRLKQWGMVLG